MLLQGEQKAGRRHGEAVGAAMQLGGMQPAPQQLCCNAQPLQVDSKGIDRGLQKQQGVLGCTAGWATVLNHRSLALKCTLPCCSTLYASLYHVLISAAAADSAAASAAAASVCSSNDQPSRQQCSAVMDQVKAKLENAKEALFGQVR